MAKSAENGKAKPAPARITELMVEGFKSIDGPLNLGIRPLTILAGANSSGKSSAIQPLLMMKQTLEAAYDPGPLLLSGPNVNFTSVSQFICRTQSARAAGGFRVGVSINDRIEYVAEFQKKDDASPLELKQVTLTEQEEVRRFSVGEIAFADSPLKMSLPASFLTNMNPLVRTVRNRFLIDVELQFEGLEGIFPTPVSFPTDRHQFESAIAEVVHVPGLRGNPLRNYPVGALG